MSENFNNREIINNENKEVINKLDEKDNLIALGILNLIDEQITGIDIDLAVEKKGDSIKYYFIANEKPLNIGFNIKELPKISKTLIKLFNNDIQLFGDINGRSIAEDTWTIDGLENKIIENDNIFSKNHIERIFTFVMNAKGINNEDWKIEDTVCKNGDINEQCKNKLG